MTDDQRPAPSDEAERISRLWGDWARYAITLLALEWAIDLPPELRAPRPTEPPPFHDGWAAAPTQDV